MVVVVARDLSDAGGESALGVVAAQHDACDGALPSSRTWGSAACPDAEAVDHENWMAVAVGRAPAH